MSTNSEPARTKEQRGAAEIFGNVYPETDKWSPHPQFSFQACPLGAESLPHCGPSSVKKVTSNETILVLPNGREPISPARCMT